MATTDNIGLNVDVLVIRESNVLLGLFSNKWAEKMDGTKYWGVPGRDIRFRESFGEAARRYVQEELLCDISKYAVFAINANYGLGNHFVDIGVWAEITGEPRNGRPEDWDRWEWFSLDALPSDLFPPARNLIESYKQNRICVEE